MAKFCDLGTTQAKQQIRLGFGRAQTLPETTEKRTTR